MDKINKLQKRFPKIKFTKVDSNLTDWEQMLLMSIGKHNIIANSSFSWWGAYFNEINDNIVCYPNIWFGPSLKYDMKDLFPNDWIKIDSLPV
jgi:hypothetical protein